MKKAILSLSGGLDSTCLLLHLLSKGYEVKCYSFDYGQRHQIELKKVKENISFLKSIGFLKNRLQHQVINLRDVFSESNSSLHQDSMTEIPQGHYADVSMKSTVVENRNIIFASIIYGKALAWADKTGEKIDIFLGIHSGDHEIYPDCRPESRLAAELCFKISNYNSHLVSYKAPFESLDKSEVLSVGLQSMEEQELSSSEIEYILSHTHTCYSPNEKGESCGKCGSCVERLEAFEINKLEDPIKYVK